MLSVWICYWIAVHPFVRKIFERVLSKYPKSFNIVYKIFFSFTTFGLDQKALIKIWTGGLIMALLKVLIDYTTARSLGAHIPYLWFLSFIPSVSIISMIPISIAGLGIREGAYVALFAALGVSSGISLSISLTVFSLNLLLCVIGGVLYLIHGAYLKLKNI
jgi:uncharacterized membrane protein YbhN (UPF0104 family)